MERLVVIDGNSIMNRTFYGIMGSKMLTAPDGTYTNAVYGFLAILFKILDDVKPEYLVVSFDLKAPTKRHEMYKEYKATRKGMPEELAAQMPIVKQILKAMNITIIEKEGYEADDILGTLAKKAESEDIETILLTGDRDSFQLTSEKVIVRIPRTKMGKTETEDYNRDKIKEEYGVEPVQLIEVKGLMGDSSDNIPGVPGVGEKTALDLIKKYNNIGKLYESLESNTDDIRGKLREKLVENKELALLSRVLGTIDTEVPLEETFEDIKIEEWDKPEVTRIFKELRFSRFLERFNLNEEAISTNDNSNESLPEFEAKNISDDKDVERIMESVKSHNRLFYHLANVEENNEDLIIKKKIKNINIYSEDDNIVYVINDISKFKEIFENENILKCGDKLKQDYILLKQIGITPKNMMFDIRDCRLCAKRYNW